MFKEVYTHKVSQSIDFMVADALVAANGYFNFGENIRQPEEFLHFTDNILTRIENSSEVELQESKAILDRLRTRDLYRCVCTFIVKPDVVLDLPKIERDIVGCQDSQVQFTIEDIIAKKSKLNYGCGTSNPIDNVKFFKSDYNLSTFPLNKDATSLLLPKTFSETYLRIFVRDSQKFEAVRAAIEKYQKKNLGPIDSQ